MAILCCQTSRRRQWREEPWGFPARPQNAITSLKFPVGVHNVTLTRTYRLAMAIGWTFWIFWSAFGGTLLWAGSSLPLENHKVASVLNPNSTTHPQTTCTQATMPTPLPNG